MSQERVYVCDRCGTYGTATKNGNRSKPPEQWTTVEVVTDGNRERKGHLCPQCTDALGKWIEAAPLDPDPKPL